MCVSRCAARRGWRRIRDGEATSTAAYARQSHPVEVRPRNPCPLCCCLVRTVHIEGSLRAKAKRRRRGAGGRGEEAGPVPDPVDLDDDSTSEFRTPKKIPPHISFRPPAHTAHIWR